MGVDAFRDYLARVQGYLRGEDVPFDAAVSQAFRPLFAVTTTRSPARNLPIVKFHVGPATEPAAVQEPGGLRQ